MLNFRKIFLFFLVLTLPDVAHAYIGPGAGFAFLGSSLVFILTFLTALLTLSFWPLQWAWRKISGKSISRKARARRVVIVGLDGLEPKLVDKYIAEGKLPNLKKLSEDGSYSRLGTTLPALSPVAWSTFQTGVNPGSHNIYDFLTRDKRYCLPLLSSTQTEQVPASSFFRRNGKGRKKAEVRLTRKSQPFWKILGKRGVFANIIRVPISYPPEPCFGNVLSAMCTPDLRGTQGTFAVFTTKALESNEAISGTFHQVKREGDLIRGEILGPPHPTQPKSEALTAPFTVKISAQDRTALLEINGQKVPLALNEFTDWIEVQFKYSKKKTISGICRFSLRSLEPEFSLYVSPINANPEKPAIPVAAPLLFAGWLAKRIGLFGTLGLMEDTWGRNEFALDDRSFLEQAWLTHNEREAMFFEALERTREGVCICVFDASDRIQHMFWRYLDEKHPAPKEDLNIFSQAIPQMYERCDELIGKVQQKLSPNDVLIILSDHGFASFRRSVSLNTWLMREGYLKLKNSPSVLTGKETLRDVDWENTKAFAIGLTGIYINRKGREENGVVDEKQAAVIKKELTRKLEELRDPQDGTQAVRKVYDAQTSYSGLYVDEAPDLILGFSPGYRVSWEAVTGGFESEVFTDNVKAWSGDHHVDPELVPGVFFSNRKLQKSKPNIVDIAPTVLDLFAVKKPGYMEGSVII